MGRRSSSFRAEGRSAIFADVLGAARFTFGSVAARGVATSKPCPTSEATVVRSSNGGCRVGELISVLPTRDLLADMVSEGWRVSRVYDPARGLSFSHRSFYGGARS